MVALRASKTWGRRGFTLIELLIVMMLIAIGFFAVRPSFSGAMRGARERTALREMVGMFTAARTEAVARGRLVRVVYDDAQSAFYAEIQSEPEIDRTLFDPLRLVGKAWVRLPEDVRLDRFEVGGELQAGGSAGHVYFYPDGRTDGAAVLLVDERGREMLIEVSAATGRVKLDA